MKSLKLRLLLLLLVTGGTTAYCQPTDSSDVCLTPKQFDFYAQALVERDGLAIDTLIKGLYMQEYVEIISFKDAQITNLNTVIVEKDKAILDNKKSYGELEKKQIKTEKKVKRNKMFALVFAGISAVLALIVILK